MTAAEYLVWEAEQPEKHEFVNGETVAMSGVSAAHDVVSTNLIIALGSGLRGGPCRVRGPDLRVRIDETGLYAYPDLTIVCGKAELSDEQPPALLNPKVVVEVLSESTANYDLGAKAGHYRRRDSVQTILLVDSRERRVLRQDRMPDGRWTLEDRVDGELVVAGVTVSFDEIYAGAE
jgi:Uma2 family endonuclease